MSQPQLTREAVLADVEAMELRANKMFGARSLQPPGIVHDDLSWPSDLSDLDSVSLSKHLTHWAAMTSHADFFAEVVKGAAREAIAEAEVTFDVQYALREERHVTDKRHNTGALRAVRNRKLRAVQLETDAAMWAAIVRTHERRYAAVSRELTRRGQGH